MYGQGFYMPMYSFPIQNVTRMGTMGKLSGLLKSTNWGGLLNNASRTLGVINQAVPLVKQVGPIYNNMKSMLKVASLFKDETDNTNNLLKEPTKNTLAKENNNYQNQLNNNYNNYPNFFI